MDRVRFGRALGKGTRLAARTAMEAAEAVAAPAPAAGKGRHTGASQLSTRRASEPSAVLAGEQRTPLRVPALSLISELFPAARAAGAGVTKPLKQASRALWHELTGSFFALFALSFAMGVWHTRAALHSTVPGERNRLAAFCALALVFLYFSVSSFARARRRTGA